MGLGDGLWGGGGWGLLSVQMPFASLCRTDCMGNQRE